jgi:FixJ family two-component response regulator
MSKQGTIIVVDDNKGVLSAVKLLLKNHRTYRHTALTHHTARCAT